MTRRGLFGLLSGGAAAAQAQVTRIRPADLLMAPASGLTSPVRVVCLLPTGHFAAVNVVGAALEGDNLVIPPITPLPPPTVIVIGDTIPDIPVTGEPLVVRRGIIMARGHDYNVVDGKISWVGELPARGDVIQIISRR